MVPTKLFINLTFYNFLYHNAHQQSKIFMTDLSLRQFAGRRRCLSKVEAPNYSTCNHNYSYNNNNNLLNDGKENKFKANYNKKMDSHDQVVIEGENTCPVPDATAEIPKECSPDMMEDLGKLSYKFRYGMTHKRYKELRPWKFVSSEEFLVPFLEQGFDYLYKKRTNDTRDGLLLLYQPSLFKLEDYVYVEYHQTNEDILNRDNVGIVVKFSLTESPDSCIVISTTHLLYNPKRNDVRLAQTQILFAEVDRIAFVKNTANGPEYYPIIVCGDFNLQPFTGVYKFITEGSFDYIGKGRTLDERGFRRLSNTLVPSSLLITDNCQHFNVLTKRLRGYGDEKIMLYRNEDPNRRVRDCNNCTNEVDLESLNYQKIKIVDGQFAHFSSGALQHSLKLNSVYKHQNQRGEMEATTNQGEWITVDYIFYNDVELTSQYLLPTVRDCESLPNIPNFVVGSDHLCLGATFKLKKKHIPR
ncbi:hypothetical protein G9C98_007988 [Cotesia typhae]|uniref:Endonuclease/exonuclease/phosphatase domain-containing protein n=1 Tax=Cotesia typhae TaxID=2053667 RepID=A0A8J5QW26_9HYME|nr:hypothetical protein G9C98_007988 [Cotesia typhae]